MDTRGYYRRATLALFVYILSSAMLAQATERVNIDIFDEATVHFTPDDPARYDSADVISQDNGRVIARSVTLPAFAAPQAITAHLILDPIPKDERSVYDRWDRAGNIRLGVADGFDIELIRFVTSYGGRTEHEVDLSYLAPLLSGRVTIKGFVDTWISPGWKISLTLTYEPLDTEHRPLWAEGIFYDESFDYENDGVDGIERQVVIPENPGRVMLYYLVTGHCTDGRDADEFVTKDNVIYVDDRVVYRFRPWRDDCRRFREVNPYTARWSDGWWSSDYDRSGWCPGDIVSPVELDLSDHLTAGRHTVRLMIEDVRPRDEEGHFGYWRVSGCLVGFERKVP